MELEDRKESLFVADIEEAGSMEVCKAIDECGGAAESGDQGSHVLGNEEGIHPGGTLVGFVAVGIQVAGCEVVEGRAEGGILKAEGAIQVAGLQKAGEAAVN